MVVKLRHHQRTLALEKRYRTGARAAEESRYLPSDHNADACAKKTTLDHNVKRSRIHAAIKTATGVVETVTLQSQAPRAIASAILATLEITVK
jgi:hypothetical protein